MQRAAAVVIFALFLCGFAVAAPFVPTDDAQVLERLPDRSAPQYRDLKRLQASAKASPNDVASAVALANAYYRIARGEGDPRYLGYAQAALTPWWKEAEAPTAVLVTRATILQSNHEFERALADLNRAIAREPRNGRALLVRSTVLTIQGKYADARADCPKLYGLVPEFYVFACTAAIDSLAGKAVPAAATLERALSTVPPADNAARAWGESLLGEFAQRRGDASAASHFQAALAADPRDLYTLGAYSDWLLDHQRTADVIPLVQSETRVDALLLRLALAQKALQRPEADATIATLRARFDASRARGDIVHRREESRFQLRLNNDAHAALRLAIENWNVQREPADLRVLAEAASVTGDSSAKAIVRDWIAQTGLEYPEVAAMVDAGGGGRK
jgi:tetratricopeptide (TPR) repeat protein